MASVLPQIRKAIALGFKGKLLAGVLRQSTPSSIGSSGDVVSTTADFLFDGIRSTFDVRYAMQAGIPVTDIKILVIAGSLPSGIAAKQDDLVNIPKGDPDHWYKVRAIVAIDPADATATLQAYSVSAP